MDQPTTGDRTPSTRVTEQLATPVPTEALFAALYSDLHRVARRELARRGFGMSLGVTTLLHEAYVSVAGRDGRLFSDEAHFMRYSARVMRGLIIDHARSRHAIKRGRQFEITASGIDEAASHVADHRELTWLSDALDALAQLDAALVEVVDLKFFCGFSFAEIAAMRGVSERTVQRQWEKARLYLHRSLDGPSL
jgi:RNA polymerase sigma factor (TIGR02999 family)